MNVLNNITAKHIIALEDFQLVELLLKLLNLESIRNEQPISGVSVPLNITVGDGGMDASVDWQTDPKVFDWIPNKKTIFQIKATRMGPADCEKEITTYNKKTKTVNLKSMVKEAIDEDRTYVLFYSKQALNKKQIAQRITSMRKGIKKGKNSKHKTYKILIYDANKISNWTNLFPQAVTFVHECNGISKPIQFETWSSWHNREEYSEEFVENDILMKYIEQIRTTLGTRRQTMRLIGLSGLGKTRLVHEALKPVKDATNKNKHALSDLVIYYNAAPVAINIADYVIDFCSRGCRGILVVDNCDSVLHERIAGEVKRVNSNLSLLTIDNNPEEESRIEQTLKLNSDDYINIVPQLLKKLFPGMGEDDIARIADFADGFPLVAVLLAKDRNNKNINIGRLNDDELMKRMLGGISDKDTLNVIRACAIFSQLGFDDELAVQRRFVASNSLLSKLSGDDQVKQQRFFEICQRFVKRGVLDRRGRYIYVKPKPLALRLAADWWEECPPEYVIQVLEGVASVDLAKNFCEQMRMLDFLPKAKEVTRQLCGETAPFGQAKVLNSEMGSLLFRSLVEVNPQATIEALEQVFGNWSRDEILLVGPGRRNLIWALEKLCFWEETFPKAARMMLLFASAENETWGNNATNQFIQLFQTFLSGTQAKPDKKLEIIDEALKHNDLQVRFLSVRALGRAIQTHDFHRMGGVEMQGSKLPQSEWRPKVWKEAFDYWREALVRLVPVACVDDELGSNARMEITRAIRGLVNYGRMDELDNALKTITTSYGRYWPEALNSVEEAIKYEGPKIPQEGRDRLSTWIELLSPSDFASRLRLIVSIPSWHSHIKGEHGEYIDIAEKNAKEFAKECALNPTELLLHLDIMFQGEQRKALTFGIVLGEFISNPSVIINSSIDKLKEIPSNKRNTDFLAGFLRAIRSRDGKLVADTLSNVASQEDIIPDLLNLTRLSLPSLPELKRIVDLIKNGKIQLNQIVSFSYGSVLSHLTKDEIIIFTNELLILEPDGILYALDFLIMYSFGDKEKANSCQSQIRRILMTPGLLLKFHSNNRIDSYNWQETCIKLLRDREDKELAHALSIDIVKVCAVKENIFNLDHAIISVIRVLLKNYIETSWSIFSNGLLSEESWIRYNIGSLLEDKERAGKEVRGPLSEVPADFLVEWTRQNPKIAPIILARIINLFENDEKNVRWNPIISFLLEEFGDQDDLLSEISSNMFSFGWVGSAIPHYETRMVALRLLEKHKHQKVRQWAANLIIVIEKEIQKEKTREEEGY